ncbi:hypothetical protein D3C73_952780 [compost metagenome]
MCANEKIGKHIVFAAAPSAVAYERFARQEQCRAWKFQHRQTKLTHNFIQSFEC